MNINKLHSQGPDFSWNVVWQMGPNQGCISASLKVKDVLAQLMTINDVCQCTWGTDWCSACWELMHSLGEGKLTAVFLW